MFSSPFHPLFIDDDNSTAVLPFRLCFVRNDNTVLFADPTRDDGGNWLWFRWHRFARRMEARRHDHHSPSCPFGPRHGNSPLSKIRHTLCRCLKPSRLLLLQGRPVTNQRNSSSSKFLKLSLLLFAIMECQVLDSFFLISSVWIRDPSTSAFLCF